MHVHETRLHSISSIIITSTGIDILNMYSPVDLIQYVLYQIHHVYSIVNIYLLLFYAQSCPFPPFPYHYYTMTISELLVDLYIYIFVI